MSEVKDNLYDLFQLHDNLNLKAVAIEGEISTLRHEHTALVNEINTVQRDIDRVIEERKKNSIRESDWRRD